jgi:hypothetical protein
MTTVESCAASAIKKSNGQESLVSIPCDLPPTFFPAFFIALMQNSREGKSHQVAIIALLHEMLAAVVHICCSDIFELVIFDVAAKKQPLQGMTALYAQRATSSASP